MILETAFIDLQIVGLASPDEARHVQIGHPVLELVMKHNPEYAHFCLRQMVLAKLVSFSILTGGTKEFMNKSIVGQFFRAIG